MAANHVFSFTTADSSGAATRRRRSTTSRAPAWRSPLVGPSVAIEGVVVGDYQAAGGFGGYYVQEEDADTDADPLTSEGIFVFTRSARVSVGDRVRVRGTVTEFERRPDRAH